MGAGLRPMRVQALILFSHTVTTTILKSSITTRTHLCLCVEFPLLPVSGTLCLVTADDQMRTLLQMLELNEMTTPQWMFPFKMVRFIQDGRDKDPAFV